MVEVNWLAVVVGNGRVHGPRGALVRPRVRVGLAAGLGFVATAGLQAVPFEDRSWTTYALSVGYNVVALAGIGVLLALW